MQRCKGRRAIVESGQLDWQASYYSITPDNALPPGIDRRLGTVRELKLAQDIADVTLDELRLADATGPGLAHQPPGRNAGRSRRRRNECLYRSSARLRAASPGTSPENELACWPRALG